jgi:hypothetical protein
MPTHLAVEAMGDHATARLRQAVVCGPRVDRVQASAAIGSGLADRFGADSDARNAAVRMKGKGIGR